MCETVPKQRIIALCCRSDSLNSSNTFTVYLLIYLYTQSMSCCCCRFKPQLKWLSAKQSRIIRDISSTFSRFTTSLIMIKIINILFNSRCYCRWCCLIARGRKTINTPAVSCSFCEALLDLSSECPSEYLWLNSAFHIRSQFKGIRMMKKVFNHYRYVKSVQIESSKQKPRFTSGAWNEKAVW